MKKCLSVLLEEEHYLLQLLLSTESLLDEENKGIIDKINSIRDLPSLYVGDGMYEQIGNMMTNSQKENICWAANNIEQVTKLFQAFTSVIYNSRSAH